MNLTENQVRVVRGLASIERKEYTTPALAAILKQCYAELREENSEELEKKIVTVLYNN